MKQYPSSMQYYKTNRVTPTIICYYSIEILVRIILLVIVCIMQVTIQPHVQHITEDELLHIYKRPRSAEFTPLWILVILITFIPAVVFMIPSIYTKNFGDVPQAILAWSLACAINAFITETGKLIIGRPRPDFFYRCFPNGKMTKDLRCTGNLEDVLEGRKSFPSGHSSYSFCSLGFVSVWICGKLGVLSQGRGYGARVVACLAPLIAAGIVAMSRCCDNHHHWEDVLAGSVIGVVAAYFCYRQYYHPLDSEQSGMPYDSITTETELFSYMSMSQEDCCCTKDLESKMGMRDKKIFSNCNKKK